MEIKADGFRAICKAIDYYKLVMTDELMKELPKDAKKVFSDAELAIAETILKRKEKTAKTSESVRRHREADPWYGQHKRRDETAARKKAKETVD